MGISNQLGCTFWHPQFRGEGTEALRELVGASSLCCIKPCVWLAQYALYRCSPWSP